MKPIRLILSFLDYVCTKSDLAIINFAEQIASSPGKEELVLIDGVPILRMHMECLFKPREFLGDEVIAACHNIQSTIGHFNVLSIRSMYAGHRCLYWFDESPGRLDGETGR